ncbi:substrate-binding periplasmic protein [Fluviispira multicolorata]|uniref:Transporter substrate-binding domain-containing protein n=1 Tax=Fluviispira multicolorata TaxID=2654512 RepID=A0A833JFM8_9BACT|nr:transporter substrate-binding domain-containing protein [Fluviispira multicolorata]KAB8033395.1 transporter substrate-binding domain-containing protein [Fluviispira multicolorata]
MKLISQYVLLLTILPQLSVLGQDLPKCFKKFTLSYLESNHFYNSKKDKGIDKDIISEISKRSHCQFVTVHMTRARMWKSIESGELDFSTGAIITPEREKFGYFSLYYKSKNLTLLRKEIKKSLMSDFLEDTKLRFGVVRSFKHGSNTLDNVFLKNLQKEGRVLEFVDQEKLYLNLYHNKVQGIFLESFKFRDLFEKYKDIKDKLNIVDWIPKEEPFLNGIIMSKKSIPQIEAVKWQKIIAEIVSDGTLEKIFRKYLPIEDIKKISL